MIIHTHPGIGDISWVYSKLVNAGQNVDLVIAADPKAQRAVPYTDILPRISSAKYGGHMDYYWLSHSWNVRWDEMQEADAAGKKLYISANRWLEAGNRLEDFMPDLDTSFHYEFETDPQDRFAAKNLLPAGSLYLGVYTSSQRGIRLWDGWNVGEWLDFIRRVTKDFTSVVPVLIGAKYDTDTARLLRAQLKAAKIRHIDLVGKTSMSLAVECLKRIHYFAGYASGMNVLSTVLGKPGAMFYPWHLDKLKDTWAPWPMLANRSYVGRVWDRPNDTYRNLVPMMESAFDVR